VNCVIFDNATASFTRGSLESHTTEVAWQQAREENVDTRDIPYREFHISRLSRFHNLAP
jgi:hypothetical protein